MPSAMSSAFDTHAAATSVIPSGVEGSRRITRRYLSHHWPHVPDETNGTFGLHLPRFLALLDQLPELTRLTELRILRYRQFAPKKKIAERVFV